MAIALTKDLSREDVERLFHSTRTVLNEWIKRLRSEGVPKKVTAFREEMAVHGRYNYCARCQTGGRILADRALSRLLKKSWPRSIDELP